MRLKKLALNTSMPIEMVFEMFVEYSPYSEWIRKLIYEFAFPIKDEELSRNFGCKY
jgi:hypothetical protein